MNLPRLLCRSTVPLSHRQSRSPLALILSRAISSGSNNLTSHMGLDDASESRRDMALVLGEQTALTYGRLANLVACYVGLLTTKYSLKRGGRVLGRMNKNVDALALYLATIRAGGVYVPVNPSYTDREMTHFVKDAEPSILVTVKQYDDMKHAGTVPHVLDACVVAKEARKIKADYGVENVEEHDVACICYTSGTTGLPKGAMLSHGNLLWNAQSLIDVWKFTQKDVLLHCLPFYHVHGMFISLNCSLLTASTVIFRPKFDVKDAMEWLPKSTVMMGVPTYYSRLLQDPKFDADFTRNMRLFISGSAPMSIPLWEEFRKRTSHCVLERYGMTEAAVITSNPYEPNERIPGSVGKILPGGKMRLSPENIVEIQLPSVFRGYWRNHDKTASEFTSDGFFMTGDIGRIDGDGYLWILGRGKDMIITGGLNVYPKEIEDVVDADELIQESAVIGVPHPDFGEAVVAVCVPRNVDVGADREAREALLLSRLRGKLADYKLPKSIIFVDSIPRNSMGKVQKNDLRQKYGNLYAKSVQ